MINSVCSPHIVNLCVPSYKGLVVVNFGIHEVSSGVYTTKSFMHALDFSYLYMNHKLGHIL